MALAAREILFCQRYCLSGQTKATASAREAGYKESNASRTASKLLARQDVQAYIAQYEKERLAIERINATGVLVEIAKTAFFDFSEILDLMDGEEILDKSNWSDMARSAIAGVKITRTVQPDKSVRIVTEFKMWDRLKALKMLGDNVGAFKDLNVALAVLETYGIQVAKRDGRWQVIDE